MRRKPDRLVYYGLSTSAEPRSERTIRQLLHSVASLRAHNAAIPVRLFLFGELPAEARATLEGQGVVVDERGPYAAYLERFCPPPVGEALSPYPVLHNMTCLPLLEGLAEQILYVDADTHFFGDVEALLDRYTEHDLYAREIPGSRRHHQGHLAPVLDEPAFRAVARELGVRPVAPFNTGVMIFNRGAAQRLAPRVPSLLRLVFRFSVWLSAREGVELPSDIEYIRDNRGRLIGPAEEAEALPYPAEVAWIRDEISAALTVGGIDGFRVGALSRHDLLQGDEFEEVERPTHLLAHYFSVHTERFAEWLEAQRAPETRRAPEGGPEAQSSVPEIFAELGEAIDRAYRRVACDERAFPPIAAALLRRAELPSRVSAAEVLAWALSAPELPTQDDLEAAFGDPPITVYRAARFTIQVICWREGSTAIHRHGFSGAFTVLDGSSLHARYRFEPVRQVNSGLLLGDLSLEEAELLRRGDVVEITHDLIHSLFHLDTPSASVVVRTHHEAAAGPQYNYAPPFVAFDPRYPDASDLRKAQAMEFLWRTRHPRWPELGRERILRADLSQAWHALLQVALRGDPADLGPLLEAARQAHQRSFDEPFAALRELLRRRAVGELRDRVEDPGQRFFLALLQNLPSREAIYALLEAREPERDPREATLAALDALSGVERLGVDLQDEANRAIVEALLDGASPEEVKRRLEEIFEPEDVASQAQALERHIARIRSSALAPLFVR